MKTNFWFSNLLLLLISASSQAMPTVYPTGTTIYDPDQAWNGYTVFGDSKYEKTVIIDMNGNVMKEFSEIPWSAAPPRVLPGGYLIGGVDSRRPHQETSALVEIDWDGNEVWRFDKTEKVKNKDGEEVWAARQHHDWQREGSPNGIYAPGAEPKVKGGKTLLLAHSSVSDPKVTNKLLEDDYLVEVSWSGEILWQWHAHEHIDELGLSKEARRVIHKLGENSRRSYVDWSHINSASYVGPNRWYDQGDKRFNPDNIIISSRHASVIAIIARDGSVVWRAGPDYRDSPELAKLGQIIGQHHPHIIAKGLPGAGNMLVFDNGGASGYGFANPASPDGGAGIRRHYSRVVEFNPVTLEKVWEYTMGAENYRFFSRHISAAQRLPNGNTLITEGAPGRLFEVTHDGDIVWEYVSPYFNGRNPEGNSIYRAYRVPYGWIPQLKKPKEKAVVPPPLSEFHVAPQ